MRREGKEQAFPESAVREGTGRMLCNLVVERRKVSDWVNSRIDD